MFLKSLMNKPILAIGILFMTIFLFDLNRRGHFQKRNNLLKATSCRAALVKLDRRIPNSWSTDCRGNNMRIKIQYELSKELSEIKNKNTLLYKQKLRPTLFREIANSLVHLAKNSPDDNLERTNYINLLISSNDLEIEAISKGEHVVKLATLSDIGLIAKHIQNTVTIKEVVK